MRILLVTARFPSPRRPTAGTFNRDLVVGLREAGDDVRVVVPVAWTDLVTAAPAAPREPGIYYPVWWYPPRIGQASHHRWMRRAVLPAIARVTAAWRPDLVVAYWTHPDGTVALEAARRLGIPAVQLVGGSDIMVLTGTPARRAIITRTLCEADRVLATGLALRDQVVKLGVPAEQVGVFRRGVDAAQFHPGDKRTAREQLALPQDRPIFLWVGRMVPVKGLDVLFDAWSRLYDHAARPLLLLIGDGDQQRMLRRRSAGWNDSVRFIGALAHDALPDWYRAADAVLLPSRSEGIPNALVEGVACGVPFIASNVGSVHELAGPGSVLVPPGDVEALRTALIDRLEHPVAAPDGEHHGAGARTDAITALRREFIAVIDAASGRRLAQATGAAAEGIAD